MASEVSHVTVWTSGGLLRFGVRETTASAVATPAVLRSQVWGVRQLWPDRVVAITGEGTANPIEPPVTGRLVSFRPSAPEEVVELGAAIGWFPAYDGTGVWRVLQRSGRPAWLFRDGVFETAMIDLDGRERSPAVTFTDGTRPVAATRDGLIVEAPAPRNRRYPAGVGTGPRTDIGGNTTDLVAADPATGELGDHLSDYTRVLFAGSGGVALVANSDRNVDVRPTEVIDLQTGRALTSAAAGLRWWNRTLSHSDHSRRLVVDDVIGGDRVEVTTALPPPSERDSPAEQKFVWIGDMLVFAETTGTKVRVATWSPRSRTTTRLQPEFEAGSWPIGGSIG